MHIRKATEVDIESIAQLHAASWRITYRGALSDAYLDGPIEAERSEVWLGRFAEPAESQLVVVAESHGHLVGFACAYGGHDPRWGTFLDNLHIAQEHKRQGIGAQLMRHVGTWSARAYPGQGVYLWVLQSNLAAVSFYERVGGIVADRDMWTPPDGSALPKLRYVWRNAEELLTKNG